MEGATLTFDVHQDMRVWREGESPPKASSPGGGAAEDRED
jgi:hypothetical protein